MKNFRLNVMVPLLALCLVLISCESEEVAPVDPVMSEAITQDASSGAIVYKSKEVIDFGEEEWYFLTPCGEYRILEGVQQINFMVVENKNKLNIHFHLNNSNFRVINESTGVTYVGNNTINVTEHITKPTGFPYTIKESFRSVLTVPGSDNNVMLKFDYILWINADGSIKIAAETISVDCEK
ncbi:hypothetical protein CLV24_11549 [Pontibacter ummariensis]|uniref:Uncharacterized protein n=1 Tax=Pontibacter ummariensis TaxID=1610492 RepID=A0A239HZA8_9BACT|nr:hypothetical protein [Pontibacter ummariensis]PRY10132.1 hypothetical protein CLV24_11549 [Pontibacter ummariensis]SNS86579.1 hypothetical protein SAMN06296052_11549 [Pontibacter ummariensis]